MSPKHCGMLACAEAGGVFETARVDKESGDRFEITRSPAEDKQSSLDEWSVDVSWTVW